MSSLSLLGRLARAIGLMVAIALVLEGIMIGRVIQESVFERLSHHRVHLTQYFGRELVYELGERRINDPIARSYLDRLGSIERLSVTLRDATGQEIYHIGSEPIRFDETIRSNCVKEGFSVASEAVAQYPTQISVPLTQNGQVVGYFQNAYPASLYRVAIDRIFIQGALLALVMSGIGIILAFRLTRPLKLLRDSIRRIAAGDLEHRIVIISRDEFGEVGKAFNDMTSRLGAMIRGQREFLAGVSHELRSPLARMRLLTEMVRERADSTYVQERMHQLDHDIDEMERLITELLTASKLDLTQEPLEVQPVSLREMVAQVMTSQAQMIEERQIHVEVDHDPREADVELIVNRALIECAIGNLLNNALKYSPSGSVVKLSWRKLEQMAFIVVEDQGMGIAHEDLDRLFSPFFRADRSRSRRTGGVGLGLMLVKRIVERHHGRIDVTSEPGKGSSFRLYLPL